MFPILSSLFGVNEIVNTSIFGAIKSGTFLGLIGASTFTIPGALMTLSLHLKEKRLEQEQKGKETQLEYLKKRLVEEKEYLEELKLDKTTSRETEGFYVSTVDNKEALNDLKNFLLFYYNLGYYEEKYFKYYQKGKLDSHLEKITNDVGIQFAHQHFEEKGPILARRKK